MDHTTHEVYLSRSCVSGFTCVIWCKLAGNYEGFVRCFSQMDLGNREYVDESFPPNQKGDFHNCLSNYTYRLRAQHQTTMRPPPAPDNTHTCNYSHQFMNRTLFTVQSFFVFCLIRFLQ